MGKKKIEQNFRVVVEPRRLGNLIGIHVPDRWISDDIDEDYKRRCEQIIDDIKRHVDSVGWVGLECARETVCEFCGSQWTETTEHNGGCCAKDEELMLKLEPEE